MEGSMVGTSSISFGLSRVVGDDMLCRRQRVEMFNIFAVFLCKKY